jgi:hypothetical protein
MTLLSSRAVIQLRRHSEFPDLREGLLRDAIAHANGYFIVSRRQALRCEHVTARR